MPDDSAEKKIIVDEDWKEQVRAEKEAMARQQAESGPGPRKPAAAREPLPPANLTSLCSMLATQAMAALGLFATPGESPAAADLDQAKYFIDLVAVVEEKTQGNRSPEEIAMLSSLLHELRMMYVAAQQR